MGELVSVIIPLYNGALFIERCVRSLLKQTYQNIEIVIVNDGSKDNSGKICEALGEEDNRIVVLHQENKGVSAARNVGIGKATGELLIFCDADDYVQEQYVEKLVLATRRADIAACGYWRDKGDTGKTQYVIEQNVGIPDFYFHMLCTPYITGACWNKIFKRSVLGEDRFDETLKIGEDMFFVSRYLKKCQTVEYIAEPLYIYCLNQNSALQNNYSRKKLNKNVISNIEAASKIAGTLRGIDADIDRYLAYRVVRSNLWVLFQMIVCEEYDSVIGKQIKSNLRSNFKEYRKVTYGGLIQKIAVIGAAISPYMVYILGKILNSVKPDIFGGQLV